MSRVTEIIAQQKKLEAELKTAMIQEKSEVLKDIKEKIKLCGFKTSDFKGLLKSRKARVAKDPSAPKVPRKAVKKTVKVT